MIEEIKKQVFGLLNNDNSGHGKDHITRVLSLSLKFAKQEPADQEIVTLIALLHDVDDYKLFGHENAESLSNARRIMDDANISEEIKQKVLDEIKRIGYSKSLYGIRPHTIEGQIVSDADMCDAIGSNGILRAYAYSMNNGRPFFDRNIFPVEDLTAEKYIKKREDSSVCHIFEKILKLKGLMMTEAGKEEAKVRHQIVIDFLKHLFEEEDAPEWTNYLNDYLEK